MKAADIPIALRRYVVAVAVGGPLLAAATAIGGADALHLQSGDWARALLLFLLAAVTYGRPLRVASKYTYDVSEVVHVAMLLLFPTALALPGVLVLLARGLHLVRRPARSVDELFNLGQVVTTVTVGALCLANIPDWRLLGPTLADLPPTGTIVATAAVMLVVNNTLVVGAISLDTGASYWRLWRGEFASVVGTNLALVALGVVAALVIRDYPLVLPALIAPVILVQYALRREVQLRADTQAALSRLVDIVELRDPYTAGHSERVAALARALALRLGLTSEEADLVETAGRVHDLGKVAINPAVLLKDGPLDEAEWQQVRQHPVHGAEVVGRFTGYRGCAELVRHHHERWDGAGYPDGLAGEAIPLGARILAVADTFDALTSARAYRPARGRDAVLRILADGAGTQWDPRVVTALTEQQREHVSVPEAAVASRPVPA